MPIWLLHIKTGAISTQIRNANRNLSYFFFCAHEREKNKGSRTQLNRNYSLQTWNFMSSTGQSTAHSVFCLSPQCDNVREYVRDYDFSDDNRWDISQRRKHNNNTLFVRQHSICFFSVCVCVRGCELFFLFRLHCEIHFASRAFNLATICSFFPFSAG